MSYNIYYQDVAEREKNIRDLIWKNQPDLLALQEVSADWVPYIRKFTEENRYGCYGYGRLGASFDDQQLNSREQFVLILWKTTKYKLTDSGHFWCSATPDVYSAAWADGTVSNYPRCVNWVILRDIATDKEFVLLNIHTDPENATVRTYSSELTVKTVSAIAEGRPVLMAGDWNMQMSDEAYRCVKNAGFEDVRYKARETTDSGTFNAWGAREEGDFAFGDYLFASGGCTADFFRVVNDLYDGQHISDHCPLLAKIRIKKSLPANTCCRKAVSLRRFWKMVWYEILIRLMLSVLIGLVIGFEREHHHRPAGMKTHIMVCMGAAVVSLIQCQMILSIAEKIAANPELADCYKADIGRMGAQVISGIGFLGAGTILVKRESVKGLTTAATLWLTACIGLAVGMGYYFIAVGSFLIVMVVLVVLRFLQGKQFAHNIVTVEIDFSDKADGMDIVSDYCAALGIGILHVEFSDEVDSKERIRSIYTLQLPRTIEVNSMLRDILSKPYILKTNVMTE